MSLPYHPDSCVKPATVYGIIFSWCKDPKPHEVKTPTHLFFGLASLPSLQQFGQVCLSERRDSRVFARDTNQGRRFGRSSIPCWSYCRLRCESTVNTSVSIARWPSEVHTRGTPVDGSERSEGEKERSEPHQPNSELCPN